MTLPPFTLAQLRPISVKNIVVKGMPSKDEALKSLLTQNAENKRSQEGGGLINRFITTVGSAKV